MTFAFVSFYTGNLSFYHAAKESFDVARWRRASSPPPRLKSLFPATIGYAAPLIDGRPSFGPDNVLHALFLPDERCQLLGPRLPREIAGRVRIQPLVDYPLPALLVLGFEECGFRVVRVRTGGHQGAVAEHARAVIPCWKENCLLELAALGTINLARELPWSKLRRR